jgi:hypothetical protein
MEVSLGRHLSHLPLKNADLAAVTWQHLAISTHEIRTLRFLVADEQTSLAALLVGFELSIFAWHL